MIKDNEILITNYQSKIINHKLPIINYNCRRVFVCCSASRIKDLGCSAQVSDRAKSLWFVVFGAGLRPRQKFVVCGLWFRFADLRFLIRDNKLLITNHKFLITNYNGKRAEQLGQRPVPTDKEKNNNEISFE